MIGTVSFPERAWMKSWTNANHFKGVRVIWSSFPFWKRQIHFLVVHILISQYIVDIDNRPIMSKLSNMLLLIACGDRTEYFLPFSHGVTHMTQRWQREVDLRKSKMDNERLHVWTLRMEGRENRTITYFASVRIPGIGFCFYHDPIPVVTIFIIYTIYGRKVELRVREERSSSPG